MSFGNVILSLPILYSSDLDILYFIQQNPLDIIFELRRSLIMEESNAPAEWNGMFSNMENNFAPWKFSPDDRDNWTKEM